MKPTPGFVYHCEKNGCNLHPCCFNLPIKLQILDAELELSDKELSGKCLWCNKKRLKGSVTGNSGWSYVSACKTYNCHAYCSTNMLLEKWEKADSGNDCLVPKNVQQPIKKQLKTKKGTKGNKKLQMAKKLFETLVSIFIGDHIIITLVSLIVTALVG